VELGVLLDRRLDEEDALLGIEAQAEEVAGEVEDVVPDALGVA
jgi:hypothetical protein